MAVATDDECERRRGNGGYKRRTSSYLQGLSVVLRVLLSYEKLLICIQTPSSPGILLRSHSFTRTSLKPTALLPKSKSSSHLHSNSSTEWMHRTGAALTCETRESKGQSWLASRERSASLIQLQERNHTQLYTRNDYVLDIRMFIQGVSRGRDIDWSDELVIGQDGDEFDQVYNYGLGQFVDRLVGWSLFSDDSEDENWGKEGFTAMKEKLKLVEEIQPVCQGRRQQSRRDVWEDASWIFDILSKIILN